MADDCKLAPTIPSLGDSPRGASKRANSNERRQEGASAQDTRRNRLNSDLEEHVENRLNSDLRRKNRELRSRLNGRIGIIKKPEPQSEASRSKEPRTPRKTSQQATTASPQRSPCLKPSPPPQIEASPCLKSAGLVCLKPSANSHTVVAGDVQEAVAKKNAAGTITMPSLTTVRKKKTEEVAAPPRIASGLQKSIMQQAQEQFQGLCRSEDGRAILDLGRRQQKRERDALVKNDPKALEKAKQEADENGEEEQEAEDLGGVGGGDQSAIFNKHMASKHRLRMMQQVTSQVLQCRKKMANHIHKSFLSPSGLGCSP